MAASVALTLPLFTSCVRGDYEQFRIYQEPAMASVASLTPGESDLASTLDALGAPLFVVEVGLGMALAWGWQGATGWNVLVSGPLGKGQGQLRYASSDQRTEGLVLFFDPAWTLTSVQTGHLVDLLPSQQRPRDIYDDLQDDLPDADP